MQVFIFQRSISITILSTLLFCASITNANDLHELLQSPENLTSFGLKNWIAEHPTVDINAVSALDRTPLQMAVELDRVDLIAALHKMGALLEATNQLGETALFIAVFTNFPPSPVRRAIIQALINLGANPHAAAATGETPITVATGYGQNDIVAILNAGPQSSSNGIDTAPHFAASQIPADDEDWAFFDEEKTASAPAAPKKNPFGFSGIDVDKDWEENKISEEDDFLNDVIGNLVDAPIQPDEPPTLPPPDLFIPTLFDDFGKL